MNRRVTFVRSMMALTAALGMLSSAQAQNKPLTPEGVTIVIPLAAGAGKSRDEAVKAMQNIAAVIRKQPGLLDEVLMENKNANNKFSHVHVMRWRDMKNWKAYLPAPSSTKRWPPTRAFSRSMVPPSTHRSNE